MGHSKRNKSKNREDDISDIIPMSNDDSINQKNQRNQKLKDKDKNKKSKKETYDNDDSDDDNEYDESDTDNDNEYDDTTDSDDDGETYERKGKHHEESYEDSYKAPNIRSKKSRLRRSSEYAEQELSELKKDKGVKQLSDKLNNNLHQIQIAIPYGQQDPQRLPGITGPNNNYQLLGGSMKPKRKTPFYKRKWFILTMKVIICLCIFVVCGVFVYKYLKAIEELKRRNNDIFVDDKYKQQEITPIIGEDDILTDKTYKSLGNISTRTYANNGKNNYKSINGGIRRMPLRDARGRFIKSK